MSRIQHPLTLAFILHMRCSTVIYSEVCIYITHREAEQKRESHGAVLEESWGKALSCKTLLK